MPSTMLLRNYETLFHISILLTFFFCELQKIWHRFPYLFCTKICSGYGVTKVFSMTNPHIPFSRVESKQFYYVYFLSNFLYFSYSFHVLKTKPLTHDLKIISIFPKGGRVWKFSGSSSLNMNNLSFPVGRFIVILTVKFSQTCIVERIASQRKIAATKD